jgi:hypothetical protein
MPELAPVTTTTRPVKSWRSFAIENGIALETGESGESGENVPER